MVFFELRRLYRSRLLISVYAISLLACIILYLFNLTVQGRGYSVSSEKRLISDYNLHRITSDELEEMSMNIIFDQDNTKPVYTDSLRSEYLLYENIIKEIRENEDYELRIDRILQDEANDGYLSLFGESNDYDKIQKEKKDFTDFDDLKITQIGGSWVTDVFDNIPLKLIALLIIFFLLDILICSRFDKGLYRYEKMSYSPIKAQRSRFVAGLLALSILWSLAYVLLCIMGLFLYGTDVIYEPVQMLYGYKDCILKINILAALMIYWITTLISINAVYSFLFLIISFIKKPLISYFTVILLTAISVLLYIFVDRNSNVMLLKYLNIWGSVMTEGLFKDYFLVNTFGNYLNLSYLRVGISALVLLLSMIANVVFYHEKSVDLDLRIKLPVAKSIGAFESIKFFIKQKALIWIFAFGMLLFAFYDEGRTYYDSEDEIYFRYYVVLLSGEYTDQKYGYLEDEYNKILSYEEKLTSEDITDEEITYYQNLVKRRSGLERCIDYADYLRENGGDFVYYKGYYRLFGIGEDCLRYIIYNLIMLIFVIILSSCSERMDIESKMDRMIKMTDYKMRRILQIKRMQKLLATVFIVVVTYVVRFVEVSRKHDLSVLSAARSLQIFSRIPGGINFLLLLIIQGSITAGVYYFISCFFGRIYRQTGNHMAAFALATGTGAIINLILFIVFSGLGM